MDLAIFLAILSLAGLVGTAKSKENATCPVLSKHLDCYCKINDLYQVALDPKEEPKSVPYYYVYCYFLRKEEDLVEVLKSFSSLNNLPISLVIQEAKIDHFGFSDYWKNIGANKNSTDNGTDKPSINIVHLILSNNYLITVSPRLFEPLATTMTELSIIDDATQPKLSTDLVRSVLRAVGSLVKLRAIYLTLPQMEDFDAQPMANLAHLTELSLIADRLSSINNPHKFNSTNLTSAIFITKLAHVPKVFANLAHLTNLSFMSKNLLRASRLEFDGFSRLVNLDISYSSISRIDPTAWDALKSLTHLCLRFNRIKYLPSYGFRQLRNLSFLDLSSNYLKSVTKHALSGARNLKELMLDDNQIANLSDEKVFGDLGGSLIYLELCRNRLTQFPNRAILPLTQLQHLGLNRNLIESMTFDGATSFLPAGSNLQMLDLSRNRIREFDVTALANAYDSLSFVDLAHNRLTAFNFSTLEGFTNLTSIDLSYNNLTTLANVDYLNMIGDKLKYVGIRGNPLVCDCNILNFVDWYITRSKGLAESELWEQNNNMIDATCSSPLVNLTQISLMDKTLDETLRPICFPVNDTSNSTASTTIDAITNVPIGSDPAKTNQLQSYEQLLKAPLRKTRIHRIVALVVLFALLLVILVLGGLYLKRRGVSLKSVTWPVTNLGGRLPPILLRSSPPYQPWNSRHNDNLKIIKNEEPTSNSDTPHNDPKIDQR